MRTLADLDQREFIKALDQIGDARRIFIHAKNASAAAGQLLFFRLRRMGFPVQMIPSGGSEVLEGLGAGGGRGSGDPVQLFQSVGRREDDPGLCRGGRV